MSNDHMLTKQPSEDSSTLEELRRRERDLSDFIENASVGLHCVGADGIILWANQAELDLLGYTREEYVGHHIAEFHADGETIDDILTRLVNKETLQDYEAQLRGKDGAVRHVLINSNVLWEDGRFIHTRCFTRDITGRKQSELRDHFLLRLDDAVRPLEDAEEIVSTSARLLGEHLDVDRCAYAEVEADEDHFRLTGDYTRGVPSIVGRFSMSQFGAEALRLSRLNEPYVVADAETDERVTAEDLAAYRQTMIRAVISVPLHKSGRFAAGLAVHQKTPRQWSQPEVELVRTVANRCWEAIERARAARQLRESEERYRSLLENANDIIYSHDLQGNYLAINRACEKITGYTREEILGGLNIAQVVAPDHLEIAKRMTEQKLRDPSHTVYEIDIISKDGRRLTLEVSTRIAYRDGQPCAVEGIARDVSERKRGEEERRQLLEREQQARREAEEALSLQQSIERSLMLLVEASGVMLGSSTLEAVQPATLDLSRRLVAADAYAIWRLDQSTRSWRVVSSAGMSETYSGREVSDVELPREAVLENPVVAEDVMSLPLLAGRREMYEAEGIKALLAVPLRIHGELSGTLTFYYRQPHKFDDTELRIALALSNLAGSAISSAELYEEQSRLRATAQAAERRSSFLAEASRLLSSSLDYQSTLARVARLAVPDLADWCTVDLLEEDQSLKRLAVAHVDPTQVEWAHELQRRYPPDIDAPHGVHNVMRTGKSEIYSHIPDEILTPSARDEEHLEILRALKLSSVMIVPLVAHGRTLGAISFVAAESGRHYGDEDLALAEALARRGALAIDNARLYQAAREANRLKDEFLATVSHELRTPLTAILGWAHLIRSGQLESASMAKALETIERNARSQSQLIDDLLDVSRIVTGKLRLDVRQISPVSFIDPAIEALRPAAEAKGVRVQKVIDTGVITVNGDPARLQQVVWNLLSNAVKFTPKGGRVQLRLERINSHIEVVISDTGIGIKPEFLPHVFERFRQADQKTTRQYGGLGLGLAIVRHLVELHGGTIRAESEGAEGQGATFIIKLPVAPIYQRNDAEARVHPAARDTLPLYDCPERLDKLKILVVDDEADTRELLRIGLGQCGAEVTTASSVAEALEAIAREKPEVLVSDIGMPEADGYELIRQVRILPPERGGKVPAVALTAYARAEDRLRALRAGYHMHVAKPVELPELVAVITSLAQRGD